MANPNALYEDMQKLDDMYEELLWHPEDELQFSHDGEKIINTNKTLEQKQWIKTQNVLMVGQQWLVSLPQWDHMPLLATLSLEYGKMMILATFMLGAFIIHSVFTEDIDDDDDMGGGMLIPAQNPIQ